MVRQVGGYRRAYVTPGFDASFYVITDCANPAGSCVIGADAEKIADRIIAGVRSTRIEIGNEPTLNVKLSAGIASASRISASTEVEPLIDQARQSMARAREAGGNQVYLAYV